MQIGKIQKEQLDKIVESFHGGSSDGIGKESDRLGSWERHFNDVV